MLCSVCGKEGLVDKLNIIGYVNSTGDRRLICFVEKEKRRKMISTWGIFWIGFFSACIIKAIIEGVVKAYAVHQLSKVGSPENIKVILDYIKE